MEFYISCYKLKEIISLMSVVVKLNAKDSTGLVCIDALTDNKIVFYSDNKFNSIRVIVDDEVKVLSSGQVKIFLIDIKNFVSSFKIWDGKLGVKEFHFNKEEHSLSIGLTNGSSSSGNLNIQFCDLDMPRECPVIDTPDFILNSHMVKDAIDKVRYACDRDNTRHYSQGVNLLFDKDKLKFACTSGPILSEYISENTSSKTSGALLMGYDFVSGLRSMIPNNSQLFFKISDGSLIVNFENVYFSGNLFTGFEFPPYDSVLNNYKHTIIVNKNTFVDNIRPFSGLLEPNDHNRLTILLKGNKIKLTNAKAFFEFEDSFNYDDEFIVDVNGSFLLSVIDTIKDEHVSFNFTNDKSPLIFDSANYKNQKALLNPLKRR